MENLLIVELRLSQLPKVAQEEEKPAVKPIGWFGQPTIIEHIIETLLPIEKKLLTLRFSAHINRFIFDKTINKNNSVI